MRIMLHIGTDKTGSSSIQEHLSHNREWFLDKGVYYPQIQPGLSKGHSALLGGKQPFSGLPEHISYAEHLDCPIFLLSWEGMTFYTEEEIRELSSYLGDHEVTILAYLREQADILQSGQLQQMKSFSNKISLQSLMQPLSQWSEDLTRWLRSDIRDYNKLLQLWRAQLPGAKFRIRIYERAKLYNSSVVWDFLEQLGVEPDEKFHTFKGYANPSLNVEGALLVDRWQNQNLDEERLAQRIDMVYSLVAAQASGTKYFLGDDVIAAIRKNYEVSNKELATNFLGSTEPPFTLDSCCCSLPVEHLNQEVELLQKQVSKFENYPALRPLDIGDGLPKQAIFVDGWLAASAQSVGSNGFQSTIRFRLYRRRFVFTSTGIQISMAGDCADKRVLTSIEINGADYGHVAFGEGAVQLTLPFDQLGVCDTVDIVLHHERKKHGHEPEKIELTRFSYEWLYPDATEPV